jgi:hypothetical protein
MRPPDGATLLSPQVGTGSGYQGTVANSGESLACPNQLVDVHLPDWWEFAAEYQAP